MKKSITLLIIILSVVFSQNATVTGKITATANGNPLIGANVVITGGKINTGAASDFEGNYTIENIPPGSYDIKVTYIGYRREKKTLEISDGETAVESNFQLAVSAIQLDEYVVTASRGRRERITDAPAAMSVISELKIRSASNPNLGDYFKNIKGIDFTASGLDSYNLSARGFNSSFSSRLLTLTDGRMANVPSLRLIAYNVIPLTSDDVSQIEVVLGPSSALYGPNAHAGVVNIISKRPMESLGSTIGYTTGTRQFNKLQARHAGHLKKFSYKMSFVNFTAYDWEYIEDAEKRNHYSQWIEETGDGDLLDDFFADDLAWWNGWDIEVDRDGDGIVDTTYKKGDNIVEDRNEDGYKDLPDFNIGNQRVDLRFDYDFSKDHFVSLNFGHAQATNINITGIGRYLAYDWVYRFYQGRWVYKNWFAQAYLNTSNSGVTRNLRTGEIVVDRSTFFHFQLQHSLEFPTLGNTRFVWGMDYQRTMPETFGTILPDGTGGRNPASFKRDGKDNDKDGKIDEWDELFVTNEYGLYAQTQTKLNEKFELILSNRFDLHSGQIDSNGFTFLEDPLSGETMKYGVQMSPKVGLLYKPNQEHTFRLTAAKAFNSPSSQGLYLDVKAAQYSIFSVKAVGNADGYTFFRSDNDRLMMFDVRAGSNTEFRLTEMPENSVLYIPSVLGRPGQFVDAEDYRTIDPIKPEVIWTYEFGYTGLITDRLRMTFDVYNSTYSDFVSDLTWVTPVALDTSSGFYSVDNPDPEILGVISLKERSNWVDGGDGIAGSHWVAYGSTDWNNIDSDYWKIPKEYRSGSWLEFGANGDTLGAWYTDDKFPVSPPLALTYISYGRVNMWGLDASLYAFITDRISADVNFSLLGRKGYYNKLTGNLDPINAPRFKLNAKLTYMAEEGFLGNLGFRYIPEFEWSAGVHFGTIESYLVIDGMLGYKFNERYDLLLNINNINDDVHREIIGGPKLGRHITLKLNAHF